MKIVIIEDEPKTARNLVKTILSVQPEAQILHLIESVEAGKAYFKKSQDIKYTPDIDLIFSDIQLGDGLCFDIFENNNNPTPIIFLTAYNEYALRAFKTFGIDYILKPFSTAAIRQAIEKYQTLVSKNKSPQNVFHNDTIGEIKRQLLPIQQPQTPQTSILVFRGEKVIPIEMDNIALFYIENGIIYTLTLDERRLSTNYKLEDLEQRFYPQFFRVNRQFLVNRKVIKEASQILNRKLQVHLTVAFAQPVLVGKEKITTFLNWLMLS